MTKPKKPTKNRATNRAKVARKPASVLAWGIMSTADRPFYIAWSRRDADDRCYEGERVVRVRITVVPKGAKR